jgi:flagellin
MTVINTNVGALQARTYAVRADSSVTKAMERLSSGLRINSAADDAAGLAVANKMESQIRGMNMAIRNSQDGISLVQTAEAAMGEINNMVIRMRELAVQMNNGVYTDADRENAQLEVTALLAEIDKVADNSAFNQVKILDGTYSQDIRAGNTNPEVINVTIDRMNSDSLGGGRIETGVDTAAKTLNGSGSRALRFETVVTVGEGRPIISLSDLGVGDDGADSAYTITGADAALFEVVDSEITLAAGVGNSEFNYSATAADNIKNITISYDDGTNVTTEDITINIEDVAVVTSGNTSSTLTVEESACVKIQASEVLSDRVNEFIASVEDAGGTITYGTAEATGLTDFADGAFSINTSTGEILASLDFERPEGGTGSHATGDGLNEYTFKITVTDQDNNVLTETVTINVTDFENTTNTADDANWATQSATVAVADTPDANYGGTTAANVVAETSTISITNLGTTAAGSEDIRNLSTAFSAFEAIHDATTGNFVVVSIGDDAGATTAAGIYGIGDGITLNATSGVIDIATNAAEVQTIENVHIRYTADNGRVFDIFTDITTSRGSAAAGASVSFSTDSEVAAGNFSQVDVDAGGEAAVLDLKVSDDNIFDGMGDFYDDNPCGIFSVENALFNGATTGADALSVDNSGNIVLAEGAAAGTYTADVYYEDNEGDTYVQRVQLNVSEIGIRGENVRTANADVKTAEATAHHGVAASSVEFVQVEGVTVIDVNEARQGLIESVDFSSSSSTGILSSEFSSFVYQNSGGTFSLDDVTGGTDAELFSIDSKTGEVKTVGLVDYEAKTSYDFKVKYTQGDNEYVETVQLIVKDDITDNTTHIADVNLGTQDGAAEAVTILDTAINQISSSQAKLGAIQNRLQYNIDNLSKASMLTQTAKGRIMDADFAAETSELSKQQILSQAATSMLAQANQSKQSVLALLQ